MSVRKREREKEREIEREKEKCREQERERETKQIGSSKLIFRVRLADRQPSCKVNCAKYHTSIR